MDLYYFSSGPRERVLTAVMDAGHTIRGVFATDPARWPKVRSTIAIASAGGVPVRIVRKAELEALSSEVAGHVCLSAGFAFLFPKPLLDAARICLNVHGTLLPRYAGARTLNWVIENGDRESGVTVHQMDAGVDTGPILLQRLFPVSVFDTGASLARKTLAFEPPVVVEALRLYESGAAVFRPQDHAGVVRPPDRRPEHSRIDPARPLLALFDQIRAADPDAYPAHFYVDGEKVCVRLWRSDKPAADADMV